MSRTRILVKVGLWLCCSVLPTAAIEAQENAKPASEANSPEQAFQAAQTFQVAGDYERAAAAYREAVSGALQQLGNLRVSNKEYAAGIDLLGRAVQAAPARVTARVDLAIAHFAARDFDKAKMEVEASLQQGPKDLPALNLAGKIYFMKGDFAAAANRLESALRMQPDFDTGYLLALADLELKNPVPAGVIFDEMQASSVPSASLHVLIGLAYRAGKPATWIKQPFILLKRLNWNRRNLACARPSDSRITFRVHRAMRKPANSFLPNSRGLPMTTTAATIWG